MQLKVSVSFCFWYVRPTKQTRLCLFETGFAHFIVVLWKKEESAQCQVLVGLL